MVCEHEQDKALDQFNAIFGTRRGPGHGDEINGWKTELRDAELLLGTHKGLWAHDPLMAERRMRLAACALDRAGTAGYLESFHLPSEVLREYEDYYKERAPHVRYRMRWRFGTHLRLVSMNKDLASLAEASVFDLKLEPRGLISYRIRPMSAWPEPKRLVFKLWFATL